MLFQVWTMHSDKGVMLQKKKGKQTWLNTLRE